jgi:nitrite reductase (NADH) small subunit
MAVWHKIATLEEIPPLGSRVVNTEQGNIALFRTADDAVFALHDQCPHKNGPLSQGLVHGTKVTCPLHGWNINLADGNAVAPDVGCASNYPIKVEEGMVYLALA